MLERDLLGPWDGPNEELPPGTSPGERYLLGKLVPRRPFGIEPVNDADRAAEDDDVEDRPELVEGPGFDLEPDDSNDPPAPAAVRGRAMAASSVGLVFAVPPEVQAVTVTASWGRYERGPSETHETPSGRPSTVWRRVPAGGRVDVPVAEDGTGSQSPDGSQELVELRWQVRLRHGRRLVEVFLVNAQPLRADLPDRDRLFQVTLEVTGSPGNAAIFWLSCLIRGRPDQGLTRATPVSAYVFGLLEGQENEARRVACSQPTYGANCSVSTGRR